MKNQSFPSKHAVAYFNGSYHRPLFAHRGCMKSTFGFEKVGSKIEIRDFDKCQSCGGSMFSEPK